MYILSPNPVGILSFDNIFLECNIAHGMIFKGERCGIFHNFTMDVDTGNEFVEKVRSGVQWYMRNQKMIFQVLVLS